MALNNTRRQLTTTGTKNTKEHTKKKAIGNGRTMTAAERPVKAGPTSSNPQNYQRHDYQKLTRSVAGGACSLQGRGGWPAAGGGRSDSRVKRMKNYQRHDYQNLRRAEP
jgi:hypothetical protein